MSEPMIGFVYIWFDRNRRMFYVGSHVGRENDGYVCGGKRMIVAYRKRPGDFKRRIIERTYTNKKDVLIAEDRWLKMIKPSELGIRYYNMKLVATGWPPQANEIVHRLKDEMGRSVRAVQNGLAQRGKKRSDTSKENYRAAMSRRGTPPEFIAATIVRNRSHKGEKLSPEHAAAASKGRLARIERDRVAGIKRIFPISVGIKAKQRWENYRSRGEKRRWITDGTISLKRPMDEPLPDGWQLGRKIR